MSEQNEAMQLYTASNDITTVKRENRLATSLPVGTPEQKAGLYNALQVAGERIGDHIGETIELSDYVCQPVQLKNDETGEMEDRVRTILIDSEGNSWQCSSSGVFNSLMLIVMLYGPPEAWATPLPVGFVQENIGQNRIYKLKILL